MRKTLNNFLCKYFSRLNYEIDEDNHLNYCRSEMFDLVQYSLILISHATPSKQSDIIPGHVILVGNLFDYLIPNFNNVNNISGICEVCSIWSVVCIFVTRCIETQAVILPKLKARVCQCACTCAHDQVLCQTMFCLRRKRTCVCRTHFYRILFDLRSLRKV